MTIPAPELRILIAAEHLLARAGLAALLAEQPGCSIVAQTPLSDSLAERVDEHLPDLLIVDLGWNPGGIGDSLDLLRESRVPVVALIHNEGDAAEVAAVLSTGGAYGLLLSDSETDALCAALNSVAQGLIVLDPALAVNVMQSAQPTVDSPAEMLTPREDEVLQLLAQGMTNKAIAHRLAITEHTVKFHVNAIMGKLNAQSRTEAVVRASRLGWIIL